MSLNLGLKTYHLRKSNLLNLCCVKNNHPFVGTDKVFLTVIDEFLLAPIDLKHLLADFL